MDMKLELVPIPVADVDRAKAFYAEKLGFQFGGPEQLRTALAGLPEVVLADAGARELAARR